MAALRDLARNFVVPAATAVLRRASAAPCVPPATGSRFLASRSSQNGESMRPVKGTRHKSFRQIMRDLDELDELTIRSTEEASQTNKELSRALHNLPRNLALAATTLGVVVPTTAWAYLLGAFH